MTDPTVDLVTEKKLSQLQGNVDALVEIMKTGNDLSANCNQSLLAATKRIETLEANQYDPAPAAESVAVMSYRVQALSEQVGLANAVDVATSDRVNVLENFRRDIDVPDITQLKLSLESLRKEYADKFTALADDISGVKTSHAKLLEQSVNNSTYETDLKNSVQAAIADNLLIKNQHNDLNKRFAALTTTSTTIKTLLETAALQRADMSSRVSELASKILETDSDSKSLKPLLAEVNDLTISNEKRIAQANKGIESLATGLGDALTKINTINSDIRTLDQNDRDSESRMSDKSARTNQAVLALTNAMKNIDEKVNKMPDTLLTSVKKMLDEPEVTP